MKNNNSAIQAMKCLAFEIRRLPISKARTSFEWDHAELEVRIGRLPETVAVAVYRALRARVTAARFEIAQDDLAALKGELGTFLAPTLAERLAKWEKGPEGWAVAAYFEEATAIASALDEALAAKPSPRPTTRPHGNGRPQMRRTGKTARKRESVSAKGRLARQAERAAASREAQGPSGGGGGRGRKRG